MASLSPNAERVGAGAYGTVFKNGKFAVKHMPIDTVDNMQLGLREVMNLRTVSSCPNSVKVLSCEIETVDPSQEAEATIKLKFHMAQCDLLEYHQRTGKLADHIIRKLAYQIALGIFHMHRKCIVHRDLKPQNILIDGNGNASICDFGLSTCVCAAGDPQTPTNVVTRWYRALEVLLDSSTYSFPVDIWSYGLIVAQLADPNGEPLLPGTDDLNQLSITLDFLGATSVDQWPEYQARRHMLVVRQGGPCSVADSRPHMESKAAHLADRCMRDPSARPTARDVCEDPWFM